MSRKAPGGGSQYVARGVTLMAALVAVLAMSAARAAGGEAEATGERIVKVVVRGNVRVTTHRILGQMRLRDGSEYSPAAVDEDLKRIHALGEFDNVVLRPEKTAEGLVLVVEVTERPVLERLIFEGNRKFSDKDLTDAVGVTPGSLLDRNKIFQGARAIERKYHDGGYYFVKVSLSSRLPKGRPFASRRSSFRATPRSTPANSRARSRRGPTSSS
jgi:outer membrane protein insertion porin family